MFSKIFLLITVFFKITALLLSDNEKPICPYNVTECTCKNHKMTCINLSKIPSLQKGKNVITVKSIVFKGGNITSISKGNLPDRQEELHFLDLPLVDISDNAFEGSANTLRKIEFSGTKLKKMPTAFLSVNSMTDLKIASSPIQDWNITILQHIAVKLTSFELRNIGLSSWPNFLYFFRSLITLHVAGNPIKNIPNDALLSSQETLRFVSFDNSGLTELPRALSNLKTLLSIDLSGNIIQEMNGRPGIEQLALYPRTNKIVYLYLNSVGLTIFPNVSKLHGLYSLGLANNNISHISSDLLPKYLYRLNLERNNFTVVPAVVAHMGRLELLTLSYNHITEISFDLFPPRLSNLNLSYNTINQIKETSATISSSMSVLDLQSNPISDIPVSVFRQLEFLSELYLDNTNLTEIPYALTMINTLVTLSMTKISLSCKCPYSDSLVSWFKQLRYFVSDKFCSNGIKIKSYLQSSTICGRIPTNETTQISGMNTFTTTTPRGNTSKNALVTTTSHGGASTLLISLICVLNSVIILLFVRINIF